MDRRYWLKNRGQIQGMEIILSSIFIIIILLFAVFFFTRAGVDAVETQTRSLQYEDAVRLAQILSDLPELSCAQTVSQDLCIDVLKAELFAEMFSSGSNPVDSLFYADLFGQSNVYLTIVYPISSVSPNMPIAIFESVDGNVFSYELPLSVYDPLSDSLQLALLRVEVAS